jgi:hypothetical protein
MNDDFIGDLNKALRYSADTVENLLGQLASDAHQKTRWGLPEGDKTFRGVLADALQDNGRDKEADVLREPDRHVMVHNGKVVPARFTTEQIDWAFDAVYNYVDPDEGLFEPVYDHEVYGPNDVDDPDKVHGKPVRNGHVRVVYRNPMGTPPHLIQDIPYHVLGKQYMYDVRNALSVGTGVNPSDPEWRRREAALENAPYEEPDPDHPLNQEQE